MLRWAAGRRTRAVIQPQRIQPLNRNDTRPGRYVLYWMQASQRARCNHALEYAIRQGNERGLPVVVGFGLTDDYPEADERHYAFMLEGLAETARALRGRGVQLVLRRGSPPQVAIDLAADAALVVADCGYLRHQRAWRRAVGRAVRCRVVQVETDVLVPVSEVSDHGEYAARTIRPKLHRLWPKYLVPLTQTPVRRDSLGLDLGGEPLDDPDRLLAELAIDRQVGRVRRLRGGPGQARRLLAGFIKHKLRHYKDLRGDPSQDVESHMSPYLHFGQIGPLQIALAVRRARGASREAKDTYLEELLVRRELAMNFVAFQPRYDTYAALPSWAKLTLKVHAKDKRPHVYMRRALARGRTHGPFWNAAMDQMRRTGKMHNTMRMYWGKKILEWSRTPQAAFRTALALNNRYLLDGRDPASYANVAWCFGTHDRPWPQRPIFGTVRSMTAAGLQRKYDMDGYLAKVRRLVAAEEAEVDGGDA
jgi:deoxyribodipyrimidine photo-lyase